MDTTVNNLLSLKAYKFTRNARKRVIVATLCFYSTLSGLETQIRRMLKLRGTLRIVNVDVIKI